MTSATDELRRMLDEREVEYRTHGTTDRTWFEVGRISWFIYERENGDFTANAVLLTPEQAIDATLGKDPDDAATSKLHDRMNATLLEYERELGSEKDDGAITVPFVVEMHHLLEEAATLGVSDATPTRQGVETCKDVAIEGEWFECSECGTVKQLIHPNYCPNCGKRVEVSDG